MVEKLWNLDLWNSFEKCIFYQINRPKCEFLNNVQGFHVFVIFKRKRNIWFDFKDLRCKQAVIYWFLYWLSPAEGYLSYRTWRTSLGMEFPSWKIFQANFRSETIFLAHHADFKFPDQSIIPSDLVVASHTVWAVHRFGPWITQIVSNIQISYTQIITHKNKSGQN